MKKIALLALLATALAVPSIAAADVPKGSLGGVGLLNSGGGPNFQLGIGALDGGTSYVGKENDRSGNCSGDSGTVVVNGAVSLPVVCAHFVSSSRCCPGSPKMRIAYGNGPSYTVLKVVDNGIPNAAGQSPDTVASGNVNSLADAQSWVNTGAIGSGHPSGWMPLTLLPDPVGFNSDYQVHA